MLPIHRLLFIKKVLCFDNRILGFIKISVELANGQTLAETNNLNIIAFVHIGSTGRVLTTDRLV